MLSVISLFFDFGKLQIPLQAKLVTQIGGYTRAGGRLDNDGVPVVFYPESHATTIKYHTWLRDARYYSHIIRYGLLFLPYQLSCTRIV